MNVLIEKHHGIEEANNLWNEVQTYATLFDEVFETCARSGSGRTNAKIWIWIEMGVFKTLILVYMTIVP